MTALVPVPRGGNHGKPAAVTHLAPGSFILTLNRGRREGQYVIIIIIIISNLYSAISIVVQW